MPKKAPSEAPSEAPAKKSQALDYNRLCAEWLEDMDLHRRLRYWKGEFYLWNSQFPAYASTHERWLRSSINTFLESRNLKVSTRLVAELIAAAKRSHDVFLEDPTEPKTWIGDGADELNFFPDAESTEFPLLISLKNGILNPIAAISGATGDARLQKSTPDWFVLNALDYDYDPSASCPQFLNFLDSSFEGDLGRISLVRQWFATHLVDYRDFHTIIYLIGVPRSGKTTLTNIFTQVMGPSNVASTSIEALGSDKHALGHLRNKQTILIPDASGTGKCSRSAGNLLKCISGGERVPVRPLYGEWISEKLGQVVIAANEWMQFQDESSALTQRIIPIPFERSFKGEEDRQLPARLYEERAGILNWSLGALRDTISAGRYTLPPKSLEYLENCSYAVEPLREFFDEYTYESDDGLSVCAQGIYRAYKLLFCPTHKLIPLSYQQFLAAMRKRFPKVQTARKRSGFKEGYNPKGEPASSQPLCVTGLMLRKELLPAPKQGS